MNAAQAVASSQGPRRLWLATGGSGGHVFPALALGAAAKESGWDVTVIGNQDGPEGSWTEDAGLSFVGVASGKLDRQRPDPRQLWRALRGVFSAIGLLRRARPQLLVGFGGFASLPGVAAARWLKLPYLLHETNARPGLVTRWFAKGALAVVLTQEVTAKSLPGARCIVLPLPVRERRLDRAAARASFGLPDDAIVTLVMGGSQGSLYLNDTVPALAEELQRERPDLWLLHQTGHPWLARVQQATAGRARYLTLPFVDGSAAFAAADLAITRAGYGTIAEAAFHHVPLLLVPLPSAAEDHQRHNAVALAEEGAGLWVAQGDEAGLAAAWRSLLDDGTRRATAEAAGRRSPEGGAARLLQAIEDLTAAGAAHRTAVQPPPRSIL